MYRSEGDNRTNDPAQRWPRASWKNAFAVMEAHALDVIRIETDAYAAAMRAQRGGYARTSIENAHAGL